MQGVSYLADNSETFDLGYNYSRSYEQVSLEEGSLEQDSQEESSLEQDSQEESSSEQDSQEESSSEQDSQEEGFSEQDSQEEGSLEQGSLEVIQEDLAYIKEGLTISVVLFVIFLISFLYFKIKKELEIYF